MPYIYLFSCTFLCASSSIFGKISTRVNGKHKNAETIYNFLLILSVLAGWCILFLTDISFEPGVLVYSAIFGICYAVANLGIINALKHGPTTLTSLFVSLSLILTTFWGFIFWNDTVTPTVIIGLILVVIAICLCLYSKDKSEKSVSLKWIIYVTVAFLGNAGCTIAQRTQQVEYNGKHGNMMMLFAIAISAVMYFILFMKSDRSDAKTMIKRSWWIPVAAGICNVVQNLFVMFMAVSYLSPSLIYPVLAVGGLAVVVIFSIFLFKEKMHVWQWAGVAVGAVAVVLLSI